MSSSLKLKEKYTAAKCCSPSESDQIVGYFSYDDLIKIHRHDCPNLAKAEPERLVQLRWSDILVGKEFKPNDDYLNLDDTDFAVLKHHRDYDLDYSLMVARMLRIDKHEVFERHRKLRNLGLLERVDAVMVRYRKKIAKNKWIKHRNHTYYTLTDKGVDYFEYYQSQK